MTSNDVFNAEISSNIWHMFMQNPEYLSTPELKQVGNAIEEQWTKLRSHCNGDEVVVDVIYEIDDLESQRGAKLLQRAFVVGFMIARNRELLVFSK